MAIATPTSLSRRIFFSVVSTINRNCDFFVKKRQHRVRTKEKNTPPKSSSGNTAWNQQKDASQREQNSPPFLRPLDSCKRPRRAGKPSAASGRGMGRTHTSEKILRDLSLPAAPASGGTCVVVFFVVAEPQREDRGHKIGDGGKVQEERGLHEE